MRDLNDLSCFHAVVTHGGFSAAARATGVPKATLSKRITRLEERLHVRLLERTTRRVRTTDVGRAFYAHCETMQAGAEAAEAVAAEAQAEPSGIVRVSCPQGLIQDLVIEILPAFMTAHPKVRVQLKVLNRRADLVEDGVDVALRARVALDTDPSLIVRRMGRSRLVLAASPHLSAAVPTIDRLCELPTLSMTDDLDESVWELVGPDGRQRTVRHRPRLFCNSFDILRAAAVAGLGIALLPEHVCRSDFAAGRLAPALPDWHTQYGIVHAVFSSRKGLVPAVRVLLDHLAAEIGARMAMDGAA